MEHAGQHITTTINVGNTMLIMADAIETRSDLTCLIDYMCSWITNPHFIENAFLRNKFKCQFYICKLLYRYAGTRAIDIASQFLLEIVENAEYSTFIHRLEHPL
jgi:hypothetical protein